MKMFFPVCLFFSLASLAQSSDFIILKKHNSTVESFFTGYNIIFTATSGAYINAQIEKIKNDTLYLREFIIRYLPTTFGTYKVDTAGSFRYQYHYKQVAAIGRKEKTNFNWRGSGGGLLGGGILLTLASGVVYVADRKKFSLPLLIAAVALGTAGYFIAFRKNKGITIGKKYKLLYMNMQNKQP